MACSLKTGFYLSGSNSTVFNPKTGCVSGFSPAMISMQYPETKSKSKSKKNPMLSNEFFGNPVEALGQIGSRDWCFQSPNFISPYAQASICISKSLRWWEKILKPNMLEIHSPQEFVDALMNAGDKLVIVDFYSPGCGGCKALYPKICQLAESNPNAIFLKVNYEELKPMCEALHVHVLPFFRFYRGADGKVCSFSCTNATIKKFKDALTKHGSDRCILGPAKGLEETEMLKLASVGAISKDLPLQFVKEESIKELVDMHVGGNKASTGLRLMEENMLMV